MNGSGIGGFNSRLFKAGYYRFNFLIIRLWIVLIAPVILLIVTTVVFRAYSFTAFIISSIFFVVFLLVFLYFVLFLIRMAEGLNSTGLTRTYIDRRGLFLHGERWMDDTTVFVDWRNIRKVKYNPLMDTFSIFPYYVQILKAGPGNISKGDRVYLFSLDRNAKKRLFSRIREHGIPIEILSF